MPGSAGIELFSTCPQSKDNDGARYRQQVAEIARWSEEVGCKGILVYSDNSLVDPWLVAQLILQATEGICPLVTVQPLYVHPYTAAKMVASLGHLHGRRIYLNMLAGGFKNDLVALNDTTPHDQRYDRTVEYTLLIKRLLSGPGGAHHHRIPETLRLRQRDRRRPRRCAARSAGPETLSDTDGIQDAGPLERLARERRPDASAVPEERELQGAITSTLHRMGVLQDELTTLDKRRFQQPDVSLLVPAYPLEEPLRPRLQALAVGALVGLFLTAGIALALLRPRAQHVDSGWE